MAVRTASTRVVIDGEAEYKKSISNINNSLKELDSALKLTKSEFAGQSNTVDALRATQDLLLKKQSELSAKTSEVEKALAGAREAAQNYSQRSIELTAKIQDNEKALEALRSSSGKTAKEEAALTEENKKLSAELDANNRALEVTEKSATNWQITLNKTKAELNETNRAIADNGKYLAEAEKSADGAATSIDEFGKEVKDAGSGANDLTQALGALGLFAALNKIKDMFVSCVSEAIKFESAMAGVAKTTDMSAEELDQMAAQFTKMSQEIPASATELANLAEVAGQLGVAKNDIASFVEIAANMGVATNMTAEDAATTLAQLKSILGDVNGAVDQTASSVVALGNNFATTEKKILDMSLATAASANNAKISGSANLALAAAVTSLGIESQNGATQISKLIGDMQSAVETGKNLDGWARAAGMSAADFAKLWGTDATAAIQAFIGNLNHMDESALVTLSSLGITETRMVRVITSLANAEDQTGHLTNALNISTGAWADNTALVREAELRYGTTESKFKLLSNSAENLQKAVGAKLTPALGNFADAGRAVLNFLTGAVESSDTLVPILTVLVGSVAAVTAGIVVYTAITKLAAAAQLAFNGALSANVFFLAVGAVAALATGIIALVSSLDDGIPSVKEMTIAAREMGKAFEEADKTYEDTAVTTEATARMAEYYVEKLKELEEAGLNTAEAQSKYHNYLLLLIEAVPELRDLIDLETDSIDGGTEALLKNIAAWKEKALAEAMQQVMTEKMKTYAAVLLEVKENEILLQQEEANKALLNEKLSKTYDELDEMLAEYGGNINRTTGRIEGLWSAQREAFSAYDGYSVLCDRVHEYERAIQDADKAIINYGEAIAIGNEELAKHQIQLDLTTGEYKYSMEEQSKATQEYIKTIKQAVVDAAAEGKSIGEQVSAGIAAGIESGQSRVTSTMIAVMKAAISAGKKEAQINSPSKVTTEMGENLDEGIVVGVENKREKVQKSLALAVESSIKFAQSPDISLAARTLPDLDMSRITDNTVNSNSSVQYIYIQPQSLSNEQLDYILEKFNRRLGVLIP